MDEAIRMERLRALPSIDELLARPSLAPDFSLHSRATVVTALREAVAGVRARVLSGEEIAFDDAHVRAALTRVAAPKLRPVINATGVVLHTNLGRAPLAQAAIDRIAQVAQGYCNLELDLGDGERGSRYAPVIELLCALTGAEDALVVNNCAAAVLLTFSALAQGKEAIVSRGEQVEIGGGFRVPEVMRASGATMIEVGTTNRTRLRDYEGALTERTGLLVKVHRSNFAIVGFTEEVTTRELAQLGRARDVPLFEDLGSGALRSFHGEPTISSVIAAGADVVSFSGDKLLGGPQAGVIVGRRVVLEKLKRHPLNRALRVDKLTVAALEATLELYRDEVDAAEVPARAMLVVPLEVLKARAERLSALLGSVKHRIVETVSRVGGGSLPLAAPPSYAVALMHRPALQLQAQLRAGATPIVARIVDDEVWLDVRCLRDTEVEGVARAVANS